MTESNRDRIVAFMIDLYGRLNALIGADPSKGSENVERFLHDGDPDEIIHSLHFHLHRLQSLRDATTPAAEARIQATRAILEVLTEEYGIVRVWNDPMARRFRISRNSVPHHAETTD